MRQALRCRRLTRLLTLQLHFLGSGHSTRIINLGRQELPGAILALPRFYQVSWAPLATAVPALSSSSWPLSL